MFETTETALFMIGTYAAVGFFLAVFYNVLRFFRLSFPGMKKAAVISDMLFAVTAGLVLFIFSVPYGSGFFRSYYVAAAALGFTVNMVTLGLIVPPAARVFGRFTGWFVSVITASFIAPACLACKRATQLLVILHKNISNINEKCKMHLKKRVDVVYNRNNRKIDEVRPEGGENRNAVKAKVRKII